MNEIATSEISRFVSDDQRHIAAAVAEWLPTAREAMRPFGKGQTQFMDHVLTVSHPTPLRNLRQILAQVADREIALRENLFRSRKNGVDLARAEAKLAELVRDPASNQHDIEWQQIDVEERRAGLEAGRIYIEGAIRQIAGYRAQFDAICIAKGIASFDEVDIEREEAQYHVAKCFEQALAAARARGSIDEGNHLYLYQLGISGAVATHEVREFLAAESRMLAETNGTQWPLGQEWAARMGAKYGDRVAGPLAQRGMIAGPIESAAFTRRSDAAATTSAG